MIESTILAGILVVLAFGFGLCFALAAFVTGRLFQMFKDAQKVSNLAYITACRAEIAAVNSAVPVPDTKALEDLHRKMESMFDTSIKGRNSRVYDESQMEGRRLV